MPSSTYSYLALVLAVAAFAAAPTVAGDYTALVQFLAGTFGFAVVINHIVRSDEVERLLAWKSAAIAFAISTVAAWAAVSINASFIHPDYAWAVMMGLWMIANVGLRWQLR